MTILKKRSSSPAVAEPVPGMWTNCMTVGNIAYISGMTARANDRVTIQGKDEYEQSCVIFQKIKDLTEAAGGSINDVVKMTIFVVNIEHNHLVWKARQEFFSGDFPACTLVEVKSLAKGASAEILVEIEGIAHIGCSGEKAAA